MTPFERDWSKEQPRDHIAELAKTVRETGKSAIIADPITGDQCLDELLTEEYPKREGRRVRGFTISATEIVDILRAVQAGSGRVTLPANLRLPKGARITGVFAYPDFSRAFLVHVEHESFDPVSDCCAIPIDDAVMECIVAQITVGE